MENRLSLLISINSQIILSVIVKDKYLSLICFMLAVITSTIYIIKSFKNN